MASAPRDQCQRTHSSQSINLSILMQLKECAVITEIVSIQEDLREQAETTALVAGCKDVVAVDRNDVVRNVLTIEQLTGAMAPGTTGENRQFNPLLRHWPLVRKPTQPKEELYTLQNSASGLQMTTPDLTGTIGQAQVKMYTFR